jgi:hypothetical protein
VKNIQKMIVKATASAGESIDLVVSTYDSGVHWCARLTDGTSDISLESGWDVVCCASGEPSAEAAIARLEEICSEDFE